MHIVMNPITNPKEPIKFSLTFKFSKSLSRTPSPFKKTEDIVAVTAKVKQTIKYVTT